MAPRSGQLPPRDLGLPYPLKSFERRYLELHDEIAGLDAMIAALVKDLAPDRMARNSIGYESAAQLLLTGDDHPEHLKSEASFAALCGASPVPASSGQVTRHRLNRGGDRPPTVRCLASGSDGCAPIRASKSCEANCRGSHSKLDVIRCLKRHIAREVFLLIGQRNRQINQAQITARHIEGRQ